MDSLTQMGACSIMTAKDTSKFALRKIMWLTVCPVGLFVGCTENR